VIQLDNATPIILNRERSDKTSANKTYGFCLQIQAVSGALIPYIELQPKEGKMPLRSIRFGPSLEPDRTENALRLFLAGCGHEKVEINGSDLPVIL
jgi:hypothetical protein